MTMACDSPRYAQQRCQELGSIEARWAQVVELLLPRTGRRYRRNAGGSGVETRRGRVPQSEVCIAARYQDPSVAGRR